MPSFEIIRQVMKFNLVGVLNTLIDFGAFFLLNGMGMPYLLAQTCSYSCGVANSYVCNKYWTFRATGSTVWEMARFVALNLASLALSVLLMYLFHARLLLPVAASKVAATLLTMVVTFVGSKVWVFRPDVPPTLYRGE